MKKIILTMFCIIITSTSVLAAVNPMEQMFETWYGEKAKTVIKSWGNPTEIEYNQGQTKYIWSEDSARFIPGTQYQKRVNCTRTLIIDNSGKVVFGKYTGEGCPFTTVGVEKWKNPKYQD